MEQKIEIQVHRKEKIYYRIMIVVTVLTSVLMLLFLPYLIVIALALLFSTGLFIGYIKGSGVRVNKNQFPELYTIVEKQCKVLSISPVPEIYIMESGGILNAMATRFVGANYLIILSDLYEVIMDGRKDIVEFIIAHELCHIKRNHVSKKLYVFPALLIPFLPQAYSRACEYTCDQLGYTLSPKGAVDGIKVLAAGKKLYKKVNTKEFVNQLHYTDGFWPWLSEKLSTHPHLSKRITPQMLTGTLHGSNLAYEQKKFPISTISIDNTAEEEKEAMPITEPKSLTEEHSRFMPKS